MSKRVLISVFEKDNIVEFASELVKLGWEIISTGGTYKILKESGLNVIEVDEVTNFKEILNGRVKTLHPFIHAGILYKRNEQSHVETVDNLGISSIDMVVNNLYPFEKVLNSENKTHEDLIENIDIGGPSMIRAAAKNYNDVSIVVDPKDYSEIIRRLKEDKLDKDFRLYLSCKAFNYTAYYDALISSYFNDLLNIDFPEKLTMTYKKVNEVYADNKETVEEYKEYVPMLKTALELSKKIRANRETRGAIDFDKPESKVVVDENGEVLDIVLRERGISERLIEDFMLSANEVIGEHFYWMQVPFIYRIHEEPKMEKLRQFFDIAASLGYRTKGKIEEIEPYMLANMLRKFKGEVVETMLSTILLRTMNQARYSINNIGHFALATKYYTHFTSPIRRYPDLLVHRMIRTYLFNGDVSDQTIDNFITRLPDLAESSSEYEKRAVDCEREVDRMKKCEYMLKYQEQTFRGIVSSVTNFGVFITLERSNIEGLVHIKAMNDDYYTYDQKNMLLIGRRKKKVYRLGDEVIVKVANVDLENQEIDFKTTMFHKEPPLVD